MPAKPSTSFGRIAMFVIAAVAVLFVLRFVASVTWTVLKYGALAGLALFVVYLFLGKSDTKQVEGSDDRKNLPRR